MLSYAGRIWSCRYFWLSLVLIDLRMRYRRSVIGLGWSLVRPILMTMILCAVFRRLFLRQDVWTFAPYVLSGLACWDYVVNATRQGCQCFFQGESYIRQYPAPLAIYPLRTALGETVHFLIALLVVTGLAAYVSGTLSLPAMVSLVPTVLLLFVLAWSLALIAGFANVYFQDTQHLCDVGFQIAFYATPIIYDANDLGPGRLQWLVLHCNPLLPFMQLIRDPILHAQPPPLESYVSATVTALVVGSLAILTCARLQRSLVHHL
jgi:lipopolysaccharide transport system permease protein